MKSEVGASFGPRLELRDPTEGKALAAAIAASFKAFGRPVTLMHVCGSHEQAIARFGLRGLLPEGLDIIMGPGCPVCVTDSPEVDRAVALARAGEIVCTYGDMLRVPGSDAALADAKAEGARVEVVYSVMDAVKLAREVAPTPVVFFASGFETTAVTTAAALCAAPPENFFVLSAHKYIPPAMEAVANLPGCNVEGFLAAGHAATVTGYGIFEPFVAHNGRPVVVAGFEPLDILAALLKLLSLVRAGRAEVANLFPRCVSREGNKVAMDTLWRVFEPVSGRWRGVAEISEGHLALRPEFAAHDAMVHFKLGDLPSAPAPEGCRCGDIMVGACKPKDCTLFRKECTPEWPVGACMVSREGACRIYHEYGEGRGLED